MKKFGMIFAAGALAAALRDNATLTIRMDRGGELSTVDCQRLSKSRPGQIRFWF